MKKANAATTARQLAHRFVTTNMRRGRHAVVGFVDHWTSRSTRLSPLTENTRRSIAARDEFALCVAIVFERTPRTRMELGSLSRRLAARLADVAPLKHITAINIARFIQQVIASLLGHAAAHEGGDHAQFANPDDQAALACIYTLRLYFAVLFNDYPGATNVLEEARRYIGRLTGSPLTVWFTFAEALTLLRTEGSEAIRTARVQLATLRRWELHGCEFASPKALISRVVGGQATAGSSATKAAYRTTPSCDDEAVAYELATPCHKSGRTDLHAVYAQRLSGRICVGVHCPSNQLEREFRTYLGDHRFSGPSRAPGRRRSRRLTVRDFGVSGTNESQSSANGCSTRRLSSRRHDDFRRNRPRSRVDQTLLALERRRTKAIIFLVQDQLLLYVRRRRWRFDGAVTAGCARIQRTFRAASSSSSHAAAALVLADAKKEDVFTQGVYVKDFQPLSVMGLPIVSRNEVIGVLYEHRWLTGGSPRSVVC